jgi:hypothetical protein
MMTRCMAGWDAVERWEERLVGTLAPPVEERRRLVGTLAPPVGRDEEMTWRKA